MLFGEIWLVRVIELWFVVTITYGMVMQATTAYSSSKITDQEKAATLLQQQALQQQNAYDQAIINRGKIK